MDLSTQYCGLKMRSPLVVAANPLSKDIDNLKKMEEHGAAAVVLYSLFEEQLRLEAQELNLRLDQGTDSFSESLSFFPQVQEFHLGPEEYLEHIRKAKSAVQIPIIASLNGCSSGGWTEYSKKIQETGADALELNIYNVPTHNEMSGAKVEADYLEIIKSVKDTVSIPVAVKLSPFFSNMSYMAKQLDDAQADALVLFNRFYQPDIDIDSREVSNKVVLSSPFALRLPLRWIAILHGNIKADLAATSGIHLPEDVIKMLMVGANVTMLCSTLLTNGIEYLQKLQKGVEAWMQKNNFNSITQLHGSMSQKKVANPTAFERAQYIKALSAY